MPQALSRFLDSFRWIGALLVVWLHSGNIFVNLADIMQAPHGPLVYVWWFFNNFSFAHGALVAFFVLSGFLVGGPVLQKLNDSRPFLRNYFIDRFVRIYIVLVPALALGFLLDHVGREVFAGLKIYELPAFVGQFNPWLTVSALFSLQGIWFAPPGTNSPLWSLSMEFWDYIIFPLILFPWWKGAANYPRWLVIGICVLGIILFVVLSLSFSFFFFGSCLWLGGALLRIAPRPLMHSKWLALALLVIVCVIMRLGVRSSHMEWLIVRYGVDTIQALLIGNLMLTMRFDTGPGWSFCNWPMHHTLADFSYTLYATHLPVLMCVWGVSAMVLGPDWRAQLATPLHYAVSIGSILFAVLFAFMLSRVTEAKTAYARTITRTHTPHFSWLTRQEPA